ncbi:hypothetical protein [Rhodopseudomonas pseudopalustris]|uniref:hypothetical protein n=1 Tax=Rhodopseudomonas pseudopalustris TaxID=1513892 RepID=UPI003F9B71D9
MGLFVEHPAAFQAAGYGITPPARDRSVAGWLVMAAIAALIVTRVGAPQIGARHGANTLLAGRGERMETEKCEGDDHGLPPVTGPRSG